MKNGFKPISRNNESEMSLNDVVADFGVMLSAATSRSGNDQTNFGVNDCVLRQTVLMNVKKICVGLFLLLILCGGSAALAYHVAFERGGAVSQRIQVDQFNDGFKTAVCGDSTHPDVIPGFEDDCR